MAFWDGRGPAKENIRLFEAAKTWRRYGDEIDATTGEVKERGAARAIESFLLNGLNATNLLLLTGAGSSFCVANGAGSKLKVKSAPGLVDLLDAAKAAMGTAAFDKVLGIIPNGKKHRKAADAMQTLCGAPWRHRCERKTGRRVHR